MQTSAIRIMWKKRWSVVRAHPQFLPSTFFFFLFNTNTIQIQIQRAHPRALLALHLIGARGQIQCRHKPTAASSVSQRQNTNTQKIHDQQLWKLAWIQIGLALSNYYYVRWVSLPMAKNSHGNEPQTEAPMSGKIPNKYSINDFNDVTRR